jgi:hypothetical protein
MLTRSRLDISGFSKNSANASLEIELKEKCTVHKSKNLPRKSSNYDKLQLQRYNKEKIESN